MRVLALRGAIISLEVTAEVARGRSEPYFLLPISDSHALVARKCWYTESAAECAAFAPEEMAPGLAKPAAQHGLAGAIEPPAGLHI